MDHIILEAEQKRLLSLLIEITRSVSHGQRQPIRLIGADGFHQLMVAHPGLSSERPPQVYPGDVQALAENGLLRFTPYQYHGGSAEVTPLGFAYYDWLKNDEGAPATRVDDEIRQYMNAVDFEHAYPAAYASWLQAERLLWSSDTDAQLTTVGHHCREALQEYAYVLTQRAGADAGRNGQAKTVARLKAVLVAMGVRGTRAAFLNALLAYWGTVSDLVQKQEHAGANEHEALVWEDARRVVFHTLLVMYEWHRAITKK